MHRGQGTTSDRKRKLGHDESTGESKDASSFDPENVLIKLLCPEIAAGFLIGKKGVTLSQIIETSRAQIKLSQNNQHFPGTTDRTLSIQGSSECLKTALGMLITKILEGIQKTMTTPTASSSSPSFSSRTGGCNIKKITQLSGANTRLADYSDLYNTKERLVTLASTVPAEIITGAHVILDMLVNECLRNFTYLSSDIAYAEANRTAGPPMTGGMYVPAMSMYAPPPQYMPMGYHSAPPPGYDGTLKSSDPQLTTMQPPIAPRYGEQISHSQLTHMPKYEHPSSEHKVEFSSLSSYPQSSSLPPPQYMQMPSQYGQQLHQPQYLQMPPPQQYMQQPMMGFAPQQQYQQPPIQGSSLTDIPPPSYAADASGNIVMTLLVPERFIGGILGRAGSIVKGISQSSGASIKATQKGEVVEGYVDFRAVRVTGSSTQVQQAQTLIMTRIIDLGSGNSSSSHR